MMVLKGLIASRASSGTAPTDFHGRPRSVSANRPIFCHVLDEAVDAGVREVALVVAAVEGAEREACIGAKGRT